jgi:hypothetical protein
MNYAVLYCARIQKIGISFIRKNVEKNVREKYGEQKIFYMPQLCCYYRALLLQIKGEYILRIKKVRNENSKVFINRIIHLIFF